MAEESHSSLVNPLDPGRASQSPFLNGNALPPLPPQHSNNFNFFQGPGFSSNSPQVTTERRADAGGLKKRRRTGTNEGQDDTESVCSEVPSPTSVTSPAPQPLNLPLSQLGMTRTGNQPHNEGYPSPSQQRLAPAVTQYFSPPLAPGFTTSTPTLNHLPLPADVSSHQTPHH